MRIVSLVPSLTELLCVLGLRDQLVGRTGFCIHPRESLRDVPKVGGTKNVDIEKVRALSPTHLVVNVDENEKPVVDRLAGFVPNVVVTHPVRLEDNLALIERFGELFDRRAQAQALIDAQRAAIAWLREQAFAPLPVLYLIWKDPWMSVGRETFITQMLAAAGLQSVIEKAEPRYPVVDLESIDAMGARVVLLSTEPYRFTTKHRDALQERFAARAAASGKAKVAQPRCAVIDGEMTSWYGSRAIDGLRYLGDYRIQLERGFMMGAPGRHA